jgi:hypothetical protein
MTAACCLYLHHLSLGGETPEADWWCAQMMPDKSVGPVLEAPAPTDTAWEDIPWSSATWTQMAIGLEDSPPAGNGHMEAQGPSPGRRCGGQLRADSH